MPEVIYCAGLEWGWKFWVPSLIVALVLLCSLTYLVVRARSGHLSLSYKEFRAAASGDQVRNLVAIALLIVSAITVYWAYKANKDAYFVALNTPGRELQQVRNDFQDETQVVVTVKDPAKKFKIAGNYQGACVTDLFEAICRKYAGSLACNVDSWNRTLTVDLKNP